ncbi:MAG: nuclear transport factor 2 family protein [Zoogloeaceae bacterium]|jgi:ketosteroid isomerase-like protein|nr:nuclear transport factor 2 family protein [Zoogloeaceae bacterium]
MSALLLFATPEDVETAFYRAFLDEDLDDLMEIWSEEEEVFCVHPTGQRLSGLTMIRESWQSLMNPARTGIRQIDVTCLLKWQTMLMATHQLVETLRLDQEQAGPMIVTHTYMRGSCGWRLVCRHCSASSETILMPESAGHVLH